ncbi:uncharacterized protein [Penaeus vannamei]|uniref:uncharacterized protein n=1 Tax=Penaeus vannamei TaxID=6689 RepID=UPI00387FABF5
MDEEVKHPAQAGWSNWRSASGVLCDEKGPLRLKYKFQRTVIRPVMLYGTETVGMKKIEERMDVVEMRMLRLMCEVTKEDRIWNKYIRGSTKVVEISKEMREERLRWYGHLLRRDEDGDGSSGIKDEEKNEKDMA